MYRVDYDPQHNVLTITVAGFLTPEEVPLFAGMVDAKAREAHALRDDFNVVVESFDFPVQSNEVADLLTDIMRRGMVLTSGRTAVVVGSYLNKLQAERTLEHPRVRIFSALDDAQDWLDGADHPLPVGNEGA